MGSMSACLEQQAQIGEVEELVYLSLFAAWEAVRDLHASL